eukprot:CAMPEP_0197398710 /NCGR_PEP_ID=MMETSP1165-20131217/13850_1 /TAXON_ID=284809 /ORGANISM="Chrysocystis fragilis, Strain CCMP3189" /LENGTH=308 /DNA_ID=CAMNT_0042924673 /DNA_START=311 /DNA_END=1235 /DNA_ORIENTATION=+
MQQALVELEREEMLEAVSCAAERGGFAQLSAIVEATQLEYACIMVNQQESSHCSHSASIQELQRDFKARFSSRHIMLMVLPSSMDQSSHSDCETLSVTTGSAGTYRPLLLRVWSLVAAATKRHYLIGQAAIDWVLYDLAPMIPPPLAARDETDRGRTLVRTGATSVAAHHDFHAVIGALVGGNRLAANGWYSPSSKPLALETQPSSPFCPFAPSSILLGRSARNENLHRRWNRRDAHLKERVFFGFTSISPCHGTRSDWHGAQTALRARGTSVSPPPRSLKSHGPIGSSWVGRSPAGTIRAKCNRPST